ncbi:MAG TPA: ABC transporter permease [Candidatus Dormibacteraeota bacterium]
MNTFRLALSQIRYLNRSYWRNPMAAFFTFVMPLMFLVILAAMLGHYRVHVGSRVFDQSTYYVGMMATWGVISTCYNNIAVAVAAQRHYGLLKRTRGTPMPPVAYFAAKVIHAVLIGGLLVVITAAFGSIAYHASIPSGANLLSFAVAFCVGAACFSSLAFAVTAVIPNADAAPAVVGATIFPLLFASGVFIPLGNSSPPWIVWIAKVFPVSHFGTSMQAAFLGTRFYWSDILILAIWTVGGLIAATKFFRWEPRR